MTRKTLRRLFIASLLVPTSVFALGIGQIQVNSALNQPLDAEIGLNALEGVDLERFSVDLASPEAFSGAGIERSPLLRELEFSVQARPGGRGVVTVTSTRPIREPILAFLVELSWPQGRLLREFAILLEPTPALMRRSRPAAAPRVTPAPSPYIERGTQTYGPVPYGDTLWEIAQRVRHPSMDMQAVMQALLRANPRAFSRPNIDYLLAGTVLRIPSPGEVDPRYAGLAMPTPRLPQIARRTPPAETAPEVGRQPDQVRLMPPDAVEEERLQAPARSVAEAASLPTRETAPSVTLPFRIPLEEGRPQLKLAGLEDLRNSLARVDAPTLAALQAREEAESPPLQETDTIGPETMPVPEPPFEERPLPETETSPREPAFEETLPELARVEPIEETMPETTPLPPVPDTRFSPGVEMAPVEPAFEETLPELARVEPVEETMPETTPLPPVPDTRFSPGMETAPAEPAFDETLPELARVEPMEEMMPETTPLQPAPGEISPGLTSPLEPETGSPDIVTDTAPTEETPPVEVVQATSAVPTAETEPDLDTGRPPALLQTLTASLSNPQVWALSGLLLLLLMGLAFWLNRRSKRADEGEELALELAGQDQQAARRGPGADTDETVAKPVTRKPKPFRPLRSSLERVDLLLRMEKYKEAEKLVRQAYSEAPSDTALAGKLLDVYHASGNAEAFFKEAEALHSKIKNKADPVWQRVARMGRDFYPEHRLFAAGATLEKPAVTPGGGRPVPRADRDRTSKGESDRRYEDTPDFASAAGPAGAEESDKAGGDKSFDIITGLDWQLPDIEPSTATSGSSEPVSLDKEPRTEHRGLDFDFDQVTSTRKAEEAEFSRLPDMEPSTSGPSKPVSPDKEPRTEHRGMDFDFDQMTSTRKAEEAEFSRLPDMEPSTSGPSEPASPDKEPRTEHRGMDFDFDQMTSTRKAEETEPLTEFSHLPNVEPPTAASGSSKPASPDEEPRTEHKGLDFDFDEMTSSWQAEGSKKESLQAKKTGDEISPAKQQGEKSGKGKDVLSTLDELDWQLPDDEPPTAARKALTESDLELEPRLESLDLELGELNKRTDMGERSGEADSVSEDYVETKLDLALAYLDMGDSAGARSLLEEIVREGNSAQKQRAEEYMGRLR